MIGVILIHLEQLRPPKQAGACGCHLMIVRIANRLSGNQDDVPPRLEIFLLQAHDLTQTSFDAIAPHRVPNATIDRKAKPSVRQIVWQDAQNKQLIRKRASLPADFLKAFVRADPISPLHMSNRCCH